MLIHPDYKNLEQATNPPYMHQRFEDMLSLISDNKIKLDEFYVTRIFPRKNGGFSIQYSLSSNNLESFPDKEILLYGHLLGPSEKYPDYADKTNPEVIIFDNLRLVVPIFPYDPKLKRLPLYFEPDGIPLLLNRLQPQLKLGENKCEIESLKVLGYRLERRCVLGITLKPQNEDSDVSSNQLKIIAKIYRPGFSEKAAFTLKMLNENGFEKESDDRLTVPGLYSFDNNTGEMFIEAVSGKSLHDLKEYVTYKDACKCSGELLRKLHKTKLNNLAGYSAVDEMTNLQNTINLACGIFPELENGLTENFSNLKEDISNIPDDFESVCIHRDFYDKQVIYSPDRTTLLDCDNMAYGDSALDYANFIAHLILRSLQAPDDARRITDGIGSFTEAYGNYEDNFQLRAKWWCRAALLRLAVLYALRPRWRNIAFELLNTAGKPEAY